MNRRADRSPPVTTSRNCDKPTSVAIIGTRGYPSYYGGFETAVRKLAPYLAERGWSVTVYGRPGQTRPDDTSRDLRVRRKDTRGVDSTSLSTLTYGLTSVLHSLTQKPDVALVMNVANGFWLPLLRLRGVRTVVNVDGIEWHRKKWTKLGRRVFKMGAWFTAKFADEIVVDARAIGSYWETRLGREGTYIPYGGERLPDELPPSEFEPGSYVLLVARFVPENSVEEFLDAVPQVSKDLDVVLVGTAPQRTPLWEKADRTMRSNPRVHWLGHISDDRRLAALWRDAAVYFHGHSVGGTNPALVQAMACGATIVARDTVYNHEVLHDAAVFTSVDPDSIAKAVRYAIENSDELSSRARIRAAQRFTWTGVCSSYEARLAAHVDGARAVEGFRRA